MGAVALDKPDLYFIITEVMNIRCYIRISFFYVENRKKEFIFLFRKKINVSDEITVRIKIIPKGGVVKRDLNEIRLRSGSTLESLLDIITNSYLSQKERYIQEVGWVPALWGYVIYKNGKFVGTIEEDGLKLVEKADKSLKDGDQVSIFLPVGGG